MTKSLADKILTFNMQMSCGMFNEEEKRKEAAIDLLKAYASSHGISKDFLRLIVKLAAKSNDKEIMLPEEILKNYLSDEELQLFKNSDTGIFSITVTGVK